MSKEIPILFSTEMVQAIIAGRKTQTRRLLKTQPLIDPQTGDWMYRSPVDGREEVHSIDFWKESRIKSGSPYGKPGDILYVREAWKMTGWDFEENEAAISFADGEEITFVTPEGDDKAYEWIVRQFEKLLKKDIICPETEEESPMIFTGNPHPISPSIHLPKWCSRIWLEVVNVRVERLRAISPGDACEEGVEYWNIDGEAMEGGELVADFKNYMWRDDRRYKDWAFPTYANPVSSFYSLWEKINGKDGLKKNSWVWVIEFKVLTTKGEL